MARQREELHQVFAARQAWDPANNAEMKCLPSRSLQSLWETERHKLQQRDLGRALEGILSRSGKTSQGLDVSWDQNTEELETVPWAKDVWAQCVSQSRVISNVCYCRMESWVSEPWGAAGEWIRQYLVNRKWRLDSGQSVFKLPFGFANRWTSEVPHAFYLNLLFANIFHWFIIKLVIQRKYLPHQMFYISNFNALCFQNQVEHVLVQATEESICHRCEYSRISDKCVIVWEGHAVTSPLWICTYTRQVQSEREIQKIKRSSDGPAQHRILEHWQFTKTHWPPCDANVTLES